VQGYLYAHPAPAAEFDHLLGPPPPKPPPTPAGVDTPATVQVANLPLEEEVAAADADNIAVR
jgi:hypothetical protein